MCWTKKDKPNTRPRSFRTCTCWSRPSWARRRLADLRGPPPLSPVLRILTDLVSPNPRLRLLYSGRPPGSAWILSLCGMASICSQTINWGHHRAHVICFPSLGDYCLLLSGVQCHTKKMKRKKKILFHIFSVCLSYLWQQGILDPCCFTFTWSKVSPMDLLKIPRLRPHPQTQ